MGMRRLLLQKYNSSIELGERWQRPPNPLGESTCKPRFAMVATAVLWYVILQQTKHRPRKLQENTWTTVQAAKTTKSINNVRQFTKLLNSRVNWVGAIMNLKPPFQASQAEPTRHLLRVTVHWRNKVAQNSHKQVEQKRFRKPSEHLKKKISILIGYCISTCDGTAIS